MKGFVLSDLHLFSDRSFAHEILSSLHEHLVVAEFLVLNGDIFDFEWTNLSSIEQTIDKAVQWLRQLADQYPVCQIYYILGNHDELEPFIVKANEMMKTRTNLHLSTTHLVLGSNLFFHGDLPLAQKDPWQRNTGTLLSMKRPLWHICYNWAIQCRLHKIVYSFFSPAYCARRITTALNKYPKDFIVNIEHIYFGHTHLPFENFHHDKFLFSNTGAAINGVKANLIEVEL